jgi:hypothetical protein
VKTTRWIYFAFNCTCILNLYATSAYALDALTDQQLSDVAGQALFYTQYTPPNTAQTTTNFGYYRLGIEGQLDINANIRSLKLGCDGINGTGCDIDIDHLSLSGNANTSDGRVTSNAVLTNPFFEIAIRHPDTASTREISGIRFGAQSIVGLLTAGLQNSTTANGINQFSGYMKVQSGIGSTTAEQSKVKGLANTAAAYFDAATYPVTGRMIALGLADTSFRTNGGGFNIPAMTNLAFETPQIVVNQTRISAVTLNSQINVPQIRMNKNYPAAGQNVTATVNDVPNTTIRVDTRGGPIDAVITGCTNITFLPACIAAPNGRQFSNVDLAGTINNIQANVTIQEALGYIHSIPINSPLSLSLQKENIKWPDSVSDDIAQRGWWMSMSDPVNIGSVNPVQLIDITPLFPQLQQSMSDYLQANPATTSDLAAVLSGTGLDANVGNIDLSANPLSLNLNNIQLNQGFSPNCYGGAGLTFC